MVAPTRAEIENQFGLTVRPFEQFRKFAGTHTGTGSVINVGSNYLQMEDDLTQALKTNFPSEWMGGVGALRNALGGIMGICQYALTPALREYGIFIAAAETDYPTIMRRLFKYFADNTLCVTSRMFAFGTPTFSGAIGTGTINRLNIDERGNVIENQTPDAKVAECIRDEHSGSLKHEEAFLFTGGAPGRDTLKVSGSGKSKVITALSANASFRFIDNPSFSQLNGTSITALTSVPGWTVGTAIGNFNLDQTNYYRDYNGDTTPAALKFLTNDNVTQDFNVKKAQFDPNKPIYLQIAWNRSIGACDGTITITLGSKTATVNLAAQAGWQILRMAIDTNQWFRNWNQVNPTVKIALTARTTGTLLVDDVVIGQYDDFDGSYYAIVGGATQFLRLDKATWTDTSVDNAILQYWFWRAFGFYLPPAVIAPTTACTAALGAAGTNTNGNHGVYVTFVGPTGVAESAVGPKSNVINVTANQQIALTGIPLGPTGTTARKIYMTVSGDTGNPKLTGLTISDNVTTTGNINTADGSLGANAPTGATWVDPVA